MAWRHDRSTNRIRDLISGAPEINISNYGSDYFRLYEERIVALARDKQPITPPLFDLEEGEAVLVNTVQIYINIINYDDYRLDEEDRETEASHERALRLLHLYYSACDRVIEKSAAQRVDFHSGRMHAVVLEDGDEGITKKTIAKAFAVVEDFREVARQANKKLANNQFDVEFRIGIDAGTCVAINNGTGLEQEPLFLGSAANHAAKLAEGDEAGVFFSDKVRQILNLPQIGDTHFSTLIEDNNLHQTIASSDEFTTHLGLYNTEKNAATILESWRGEIASSTFPDLTNPNFTFHHKEPPLKAINYKDLTPSNSIRIPLTSIYADLSGYTAYIDNAIESGNIVEAVKALYVLREEFKNVIEKDFKGRKVRFIGDCIHALLAEGNSSKIDNVQTAIISFECAGGLRSSFEICRTELKTIDGLGLTIGIEYGITPISRIGIRGERSVRVASSVATTASEQLQQESKGNETKFGSNIRRNAPEELEDLVDHNGVVEQLDYDEVATCLSNAPETIAAPTYINSNSSSTRAHTSMQPETSRAHCNLK